MDIVCFSHLRWDFVYQRPQHLLSRLASQYNVYYVEEPFYHSETDSYAVNTGEENVSNIKIYLSGDERDSTAIDRHKEILSKIFQAENIRQDLFWYYTPMALLYTNHFNPLLTVYDCMDELSAFRFAPFILKEMETGLLNKADIVFTGGYSLYEAKKGRHPHVYAFPSSIDKAHFNKARTHNFDPLDQSMIPHPRFGFYGVLDERLDVILIDEMAQKKPDWQFILIGPVVKIDERTLPRHQNIHYLGSKSYSQLPAYLGGWDVAMLCFAINESTRYISPTKTPEYLAGGKPVISAPVHDVVREYGDNYIVHIADGADEFIQVGEEVLSKGVRKEWLNKVDELLAGKSWDKTVEEMQDIIQVAMQNNFDKTEKKQAELYV